MTAAASFFMYLLPLASLPIIFHLLMRRRRKKRVFSTLMFFHRVDPRLSSRRKLRELLLLASRVLLIALLLLALARLTLHAAGGLLGLQGQQAVVVVIDNSASMASPALGAGQSKLHLAIESARALLDHLDKSAESGVVLLVPDFLTGLDNAGMTTDHTGLARALDRVQPTEATGTPGRALSRAISLLQGSESQGAGAIHVFTDLQESEWTQSPPSLGDNVWANVQVVFHRIQGPAAEGANVAIVQAELIGRRILPRQPASIQVLLRNDGPGSAKVMLNSEDDQRKTSSEMVQLEASQERLVHLLALPETPGFHWMKIWIEGDSFAGDNRAVVGYQCDAKASVVLAGQAAEYGVLPFALSPYGDGRFTSLQLLYAPVDDLRTQVKREKPVLVVLSWDDVAKLGNADWLQDFIQRGGNLGVVPTPSGAVDGGETPAWLGAKIGGKESLVKDVRIEVIDKTAPFWSGFRDAEGRLRLGQVFARQYQPLNLAKDAGYAPLLGHGQDKIVLATRKLGKGQIVVSGLALDPQWSSLPRLKSIVLLAQTMALGARTREAAGLYMTAGNPPPAFPSSATADESGDVVNIVSLVGDPFDWTGVRGQVPVFPRSGAYSVRVGKEPYCLSVRSSELEGNRRFIETGVIPAMGHVPHTVRTLEETDLKEALAAERTGLPLYLPLVILATLALVAESLLGAPPPVNKSLAA